MFMIAGGIKPCCAVDAGGRVLRQVNKTEGETFMNKIKKIGLGVHVVGEQATELVHLGLVAMMSGSGGQALQSHLLQLSDAWRSI